MMVLCVFLEGVGFIMYMLRPAKKVRLHNATFISIFNPFDMRGTL